MPASTRGRTASVGLADGAVNVMDKVWLGACALACLVGLGACGDDEGDGGGSGGMAGSGAGASAGLAITGSYEDAFGGTHEISEQVWQSGDAAFEITTYSNSEQYLVAQNAATNAYNPGLWSRFDWTTDAGDLYYCQTAYAAESEAAALATERADDASLSNGCGGFEWTLLAAQ